MSVKQTSKKPTLKELYSLREKIRIELLGQDDPEYRQELENLLKAVKKKIVEVFEEEESKELANQKKKD